MEHDSSRPERTTEHSMRRAPAATSAVGKLVERHENLARHPFPVALIAGDLCQDPARLEMLDCRVGVGGGHPELTLHTRGVDDGLANEEISEAPRSGPTSYSYAGGPRLKVRRRSVSAASPSRLHVSATDPYDHCHPGRDESFRTGRERQRLEQGVKGRCVEEMRPDHPLLRLHGNDAGARSQRREGRIYCRLSRPAPDATGRTIRGEWLPAMSPACRGLLGRLIDRLGR